VELEIQLDEIKEQYNNVIRNSNSKAQQKKMAFLERNLEQLTLVQKQVGFHLCPSYRYRFNYPVNAQLVDQNSALKKEAGIAERKLLARNERIQNLEALLQDADRRLSVQNQKFEAQLQAVKERLDQARGELRGWGFPGKVECSLPCHSLESGHHLYVEFRRSNRETVAWRRGQWCWHEPTCSPQWCHVLCQSPGEASERGGRVSCFRYILTVILTLTP
jgi:hypothetical protein